MDGLEGTLKDHPVPTPCSLQAAPWHFVLFLAFSSNSPAASSPSLLWQHFCPTEENKYIKAVKALLFWPGGGGAPLLGDMTSHWDGWLSPH